MAILKKLLHAVTQLCKQRIIFQKPVSRGQAFKNSNLKLVFRHVCFHFTPLDMYRQTDRFSANQKIHSTFHNSKEQCSRLGQTFSRCGPVAVFLIRQWTLGFHKRLGVYRLASQTSQGEIFCTELSRKLST
jgi:hypothetical protein